MTAKNQETGVPAGSNAVQAHEGSPCIGNALRLRRKVKGHSLQTVAVRAGLSTGMLSQVERGLATPSIRSLRAICDALDMPVSWLFGTNSHDANSFSAVLVREGDRRVLAYQDGALRKEILTPDAQPGIQMLRFILAAGADSGEPYSDPVGAKCGLVLKGTLGLELDGKKLAVATGDSFAFPATTSVRFWTIGSDTCEVIWVVSPATV